jgi:hypothetical protein
MLAILAALPPLAHVLELPNKLALDGELWLAVQQHLYRGWGPFLGGWPRILPRSRSPQSPASGGSMFRPERRLGRQP